MIGMKVAMRTCFGTSLRSREIRPSEQAITKVVARPIAMALRTLLVMASVGHIPSTMTNTGFCFQSPLVNACIASMGDCDIVVP